MQKFSQKDGEFELAFANLAFSVLQSESPMLLEHLIGFELIDKNDEETHAIGVFGFKLGKQLLYAPVFFINGQLKGSELLYISNMDLFVPRTDGWVQYLLNKKPYILGEAEPMTEGQLGIGTPDIRRSGGGGPAYLNKWGSAGMPQYRSKWVADSIGMFQWDAGKYKCMTKLSTFINDTAKYGTSKILATALLKSAKLRDAFTSVYSDITPFLKNAKLEIPSEENLPKVEIHYSGDVSKLVDEGDKERIMRGEIVIKDTRDNTSKVYKAETGSNLFNPTDTGIYEVFMRDGKFQRAYIFMSMEPINNTKSKPALVVAPDSKAYAYYWPQSLWVRSRDTSGEDKFFNNGSDPSDVSIGSYYFLVGPNGEATTVFRVLNKISDAKNKTLELWVNPKEDNWDVLGSRKLTGGLSDCLNAPCSYGSKDDPFSGGQYLSFYEPCSPDTGSKTDEQLTNWFKGRRIIISDNSRIGSVQRIGDTTLVPATFKAIKLNDSAKDKVIWQDCSPGTLNDLTLNLVKSSNEVRDLTIINDGLNYHFRIGRQELGPMSKRASLHYMANDLGINANTANQMLDKNGKSRYFVKLAISAPAIPDPVTYSDQNGNTMMPPMEQSIPALGLSQDKGQRGNDLDPATVDLIRQSAGMASSQNGQSEVFDTSVMSGLVKAVKVDSLVDRYLSDMINGLDRIGRILFMYYWHNDKFKERYGQSDLVELEDSLRNVFQGLGELVLFLKQRTISEAIDAQATNVDLSELI